MQGEPLGSKSTVAQARDGNGINKNHRNVERSRLKGYLDGTNWEYATS